MNYSCLFICQKKKNIMLRDVLTYSIQQRPSWEAYRSSACQKITRILYRPKVHYRIYNSPPAVPVRSQTDPAHGSPFLFSMIHFNIILPSMPESSKYSPSLRFIHQIQSSWFDYLTNNWWRVQSIKLNVQLCQCLCVHLVKRLSTGTITSVVIQSETTTTKKS
jgi:hypothetical protein